MRDREPLCLMSGTERDSYLAWLKRIAGRKRGSLPDHLRTAASQLAKENDL